VVLDGVFEVEPVNGGRVFGVEDFAHDLLSDFILFVTTKKVSASKIVDSFTKQFEF